MHFFDQIIAPVTAFILATLRQPLFISHVALITANFYQRTMSSSSQHPAYLTPFNDSDLSPKQLQFLTKLEQDFDLNASDLNKVVKQFLWEFNEGLSRVAKTADEADTFLPMM